MTLGNNDPLQNTNRTSIVLQVLEEADCKEEGIDMPLEEQMMNMSIVDSDLSKVYI